MIEANEYLLSERPFVVRRTVAWTDCDPAGVAFTGNFTGYLIGAVMMFYRRVLGWAPHIPGRAEPFGLPCKHMALTFHRSLPPDAVVDIRITVATIRTRTFDLRAVASLPDGTVAFEGVFAPICIEPGSRTSKALPPSVRTQLEAYLDTSESQA